MARKLRARRPTIKMAKPRLTKQKLSLHSEIPGARVRRKFVLVCAQCGMRWMRAQAAQINLILIRDAKMSRLHRQFMGLAGTTDVMSFDLSDSPRRVEGEVYICLDQARRQARFYRVPIYKEVARLAAHGVLHLAGFDDATAKGRATMRKLEDKCLQAAERRTR
jgi:probable rRNA maturation factor